MNTKHLLAVSAIFMLAVPSIAKQDGAIVHTNKSDARATAHTKWTMRVVSSARVSRAKQTTSLMQLGQQGVSAQYPTEQTIAVFVNYSPVTFEATSQPMMSGGRVMMPLRGVLQKLGGTILYDPELQVITGARSASNSQFRVQIGSKEALLNGNTISLDAAPQDINGTIYVPLRFLSEALGATVNWRPRQNTAYITVNSDEATTASVYPALRLL